MRLGGKISAAEASVRSVVPFTNLNHAHRPDPPEEMAEAEAKVWRTVVARMPPDWFPAETHGVLTQYCEHVVNANSIADIKHKLQAKGLKTPKQWVAYRHILRDEMQQTRQIAALATRMRITQQSTYDKSKKKGSTAPHSLWDV
jgi:hypothetical protein